MPRAVLPTDLIPAVGRDLPGPGVPRKTRYRRAPGEVVLFASCLNEIFGPARPAGRGKAAGAPFAFLALCDRAGVTAQIPKGVEGLCCGTVWRSKGLTDGLGVMAAKTARVLLEASRDGQVPIVMDASSCTHGLHELGHDLEAAGHHELAERFARVQVMDSVAFTAAHLLDRLRVTRKLGSVVLHPTCSDKHAGDLPGLLACARALAERVTVPDAVGCCAFAGDRGMLHPELTAAATAPEASEVNSGSYDAYLSTNRTCELGMSRATGRTYRHVLEVLAEVTA